ncbi:MAG TPA: class I SAM-dependent methyltransferase [Pseudonocardiaceae bacterium]|nr:class I SAM-dependent methyltransferase [Pseudonocardiaceae bacterium]
MTSRDTLPDLADTNLFYRQPGLYDQVQADPLHEVARQVERFVAQYAPAAQTLLDFGCGTGRDLEYLTTRFDCVGVDVQPRMVAYANQVRPQLDVRLGDMRDFRLGEAVDVVTCLGNSLAYIREPGDLADVFGTFAAHSRPGTLLIIATLSNPVLAEPKRHRIDTADLHGEVTVSYEWDEETGINTMLRTWLLDDGETNIDCIRRHVVPPIALSELLVVNRFDQLGPIEAAPSQFSVAISTLTADINNAADQAEHRSN